MLAEAFTLQQIEEKKQMWICPLSWTSSAFLSSYCKLKLYPGCGGVCVSVSLLLKVYFQRCYCTAKPTGEQIVGQTRCLNLTPEAAICISYQQSPTNQATVSYFIYVHNLLFLTLTFHYLNIHSNILLFHSASRYFNIYQPGAMKLAVDIHSPKRIMRRIPLFQ